MAAATYDLIRTLGQYPTMSDQGFTLIKTLDTATHNIGLGESADILVTPQEQSLVTRVTAVLLTAEGGAATVDIGDEADPDGWVDGGNANGTAGAVIAKAGTEAYAGGKVYAAGTPLRLTAVAALDAAKIMIVVEGVTLGRP